MTATKLIKELQALVNKHGDKPVLMEDWNEWYQAPAEVETIEYFDSSIHGFVFILDIAERRFWPTG